MQEKELQYFVDNQTELFKQFPNQYLVIKDQKVIGIYDNGIDAYFEAQQEHELGSFLIQFCSLNQDTSIQKFIPNAMIA
jgi:hypothetical protein